MCFAEMKDPVKEKLQRFGLLQRFGEGAFFATIDEAVGAFVGSRAAAADAGLAGAGHGRIDERAG
jgi:hypothetical protein